VPVGGVRRWGNGGGWIWYKYCVYMYVNLKMISVETVPEMGGRKMKWEIQAWNIWYIVRTFVNATMYSHPIQHQNINK
jgi:hypothetical protein